MTSSGFKMCAALAFGLSVAALAGGCNLEPTPIDQPTYETDVRPILMARCVRCHGSPPLGDPGAGPPVGNVRFDVYGDTNCDTPDAGNSCVHGAKYIATSGRLKMFLDLPQDQGGMPPLPAPKLTSFQQDTILNWAAEPSPLEK